MKAWFALVAGSLIMATQVFTPQPWQILVLVGFIIAAAGAVAIADEEGD